MESSLVHSGRGEHQSRTKEDSETARQYKDVD